MEGSRRQAVILALLQALREHEGWCGETHVHKSSHFLEDGLNVPLELEFIMYKHGPFSFELDELLGELRAAQLLDVEPSPPYGPRLRPSRSGEALIDRFPKTVKRYKRQIEFVAESLANCNVRELEKLGSALFVTTNRPGADTGARAEAIQEFKPRLSKTDAVSAIEKIDALLSEAPTKKRA